MSDALGYARQQAILWQACVIFGEKFQPGTKLMHGKREVTVKSTPSVLGSQATVFCEEYDAALNLEELSLCPQ